MSGKKGMRFFTSTTKTQMCELKAQGETLREIGNKLGLNKEQVKNYFKRQRKKERNEEFFKTPKPIGRPRKNPLPKDTDPDLRIKELEREVELYKSFLHATGRM